VSWFSRNDKADDIQTKVDDFIRHTKNGIIISGRQLVSSGYPEFYARLVQLGYIQQDSNGNWIVSPKKQWPGGECTTILERLNGAWKDGSCTDNMLVGIDIEPINYLKEMTVITGENGNYRFTNRFVDENFNLKEVDDFISSIKNGRVKPGDVLNRKFESTFYARLQQLGYVERLGDRWIVTPKEQWPAEEGSK